jgi:hypothetical protein
MLRSKLRSHLEPNEATLCWRICWSAFATFECPRRSLGERPSWRRWPETRPTTSGPSSLPITSDRGWRRRKSNPDIRLWTEYQLNLSFGKGTLINRELNISVHKSCRYFRYLGIIRILQNNIVCKRIGRGECTSKIRKG